MRNSEIIRKRFGAMLARFACAMGVWALLFSPVSAQQSMGGADAGAVTNSTFTSGIADGAPVDYRQQFNTDTAVVYYYTEVVGLGGQKVTHRWKLEGKVTKEVVLPLKGSRQGVWSMHKMQPDRTGNWMVEVVNPRGEVIKRENFAYSPPL